MIDWPETWTMMAGVGTGVMALAVVATAIYAIKSWKKTLKRDKQDIVGKLFTEFSHNSEISTGIQQLSNSKLSDTLYKTNAEEIISFFAKLGKLLKEDIISTEDIMIHFYNYLFYEKKMIIIIDNLKSLVPEIPEYYLEDFNYLMNRISNLYNIKSYKNIINGSFSLSGKLTFSGSLSIKVIPAKDNYKNLSDELRKELEGRYDPVENVRNEEYINLIIDKYFPKMNSLDYGLKIQILNIIKNSLIEKKEHGKISEWFQLCKGIFKILENEITPEQDSLIIADIIVRISRWYKTIGNVWVGFLPYIREIVKIIWGDIEDLYSMYSGKY